MFTVEQVLLLNSDLQILFGQQRAAGVQLQFTELTTKLSEHLHKGETNIFKFGCWRVGFKRLNSQALLILMAKMNDEQDLNLFSALLNDLHAVFLELFPSVELDYLKHTEKSSIQTNPVFMLKGFGLLKSRRLLKLDGLDAAKFLQGLTTNDIEKCASEASSGQFTAFLNAQGRMMHDAFIFKANDAFYIDCDGQSQERLFLHLQTYNLRSRTSISMVPEDSGLTVAVGLNEQNESFPSLAKVSDQRASWNMTRFLINAKELPQSAQSISEGRYHRERLLAGIPEGPFEIPARQAIPLEYNFDLMHAIALHKGCYLGQELITRTLHRGVVRKRVFPLLFHRYNYETGEPEGFKGFDADLAFTSNLDRQTELLPTSIQGEAGEGDTFIIPKGKLRILSRNDAIGRLVVANGNIGLGLMRLEQLQMYQKNLAVFDHIRQIWLMADVVIPSHLRQSLE